MDNLDESLIVLHSVDSTNNYAMGLIHSGMAKSGIAVMAHNQTSGKGRNEKEWKTPPGENLTISFIFNSSVLPVYKQFYLSILSSLACCDLFKKYGAEKVKIKWPNDIYYGDKKSGGILIENVITGNTFKWSVIGIGLNINQQSFSSEINGTSLFGITGIKTDIKSVARELQMLLRNRFEKINSDNFGEYLKEYNQHLYGIGETRKLRSGNISFETTIQEVNIEGELLTLDTIPRIFKFDAVQWII